MITQTRKHNVQLNTSRQAFYKPSRFTYLARNGAFLSILGKHYPGKIKNIVLLGSGPIEPFEVADIEYFANCNPIRAIDYEQEVLDAIRECKKSGTLDLSKLSTICRSEDAENPYLQEHELISRQIGRVHDQGCHIKVEKGWLFRKNRFLFDESRKRVTAEPMDLRHGYIKDIDKADIVFEGYLLINWAKEGNSSELIKRFLGRLFSRMNKNAWFASSTSVTQYLGAFPGSMPYMRQIAGQGRVPAAGALGKWKVETNGRATSQFVAVYKSPADQSKYWTDLGLELEDKVISALEKIELKADSREAMDKKELLDAMEIGDVLSFREVRDGKYDVVRKSWNELTNQIQYSQADFELIIDNRVLV